jgi:P-type E1-E2 ATPase
LKELVQTSRIQFNLIGAFALKDKIRSKVKTAVTFSREQAMMNVRLISGDHVETATAVAE